MTIRHKFAAALTAYLLTASLAFAQPEVEIEYITSFGCFGKTEPGTFGWPVAIAIDDQGRIITTDNENHRLQRCMRRAIAKYSADAVRSSENLFGR